MNTSQQKSLFKILSNLEPLEDNFPDIDESIPQDKTMILSNEDQEIFFNALLNPSEANKELKQALIDHDKIVDSDV